MGQLDGKACVITGGAGSIGRATAALFLKEGARGVLLVDRDAEALARAAQALPRDRVACVDADVTLSADTQRYLDGAVSRWGPLDVLISNAGTTGVIRPIGQYPDEVFDAVLAVHVRGAFLACKHALPRMRDGGSIVITSSVAGLRGDPGVVGYITAKHAQVGLMRVVAKEAAPRRIRVNTVHPGPVDNDFQHGLERELSGVLGRDATQFFDGLIPLGRHAQTAEVARAVCFLAGDHSSFTTGSMLMVDGGMHV